MLKLLLRPKTHVVTVLTMSAKMKRSSKKKPENIDESVNDESYNDLDPHAFADSLHNLHKTDPEFYDFLKENDEKLLNFNVDSEGSDDNGSGEEPDEDDVHKPPEGLQADSDDSDFESGETVSVRKLTLKTINEWQAVLQSEGKIPLATLSNVVNAFHSALLRVSAPTEATGDGMKVEGSGVFNSVIQMCVLYLQPAIKKVLGMDRTNKSPQKCKRWIKIKGLLKTYFIDLFKLLGSVTSINILTILLKHLHQMSVFVACFPSLTKPMYKRLIVLWSSSEETVRVLAFLCILRVTRNNQPLLLNNVLKMMYMSYVKNSKFVSPNTRPGILFMRRSLIEMYALDVNVSYQHVFLYVRQLAIHLRNAIILHKKENIQVVYNWQFINSLQLWAELLAATKSKPQLQSLIYPLVMIVTNTIKLVPTPQYYPLRFHCIQILINLSRDADVFIPILPFILEVLTMYDFSKKHKKVTMKPINFDCILRLSKSHLSENGFKDAVIEKVYALLLGTLSIYSNTISFPDVVIMCTIQLKNFLKKCPVANYTRKIRMIVEKIEENAQFIENARRKVTFQLADTKAIKAWETTIGNGGTPMQTFYDNWIRLNIQQNRKRNSKNDDLADKLPTIMKKPIKSKNKSDGPVELFPSDSENENNFDDEEMSEPPPKKIKKIKNNRKEKKPAAKADVHDETNDVDDEVNDFNVSDW